MWENQKNATKANEQDEKKNTINKLIAQVEWARLVT